MKRKLNNVEEQLKDIQNQISDLDTASESIALSDLKLLLTYRYFRAHDLSRKTSSFSIATSSEKVFYDLMLLEQSEIIENLNRGEDKNLEIERLEKLTTELPLLFQSRDFDKQVERFRLHFFIAGRLSISRIP